MRYTEDKMATTIRHPVSSDVARPTRTKKVPPTKALAATKKFEMVYFIFGTKDPGAIHLAIENQKLASAVLGKLGESLDLGRDELAALFGMHPRTLLRRQDSMKPLGLAEADRVYRISRVVDLAIQMIGNRDKSNRWLRQAVPALGGATPFEMLRTEAGTREVERVLYNIGYGGVA